MLHPTPELKETPSQTAGPYVHIGMTPNFCDIRGVYPDDLGSTMLTESTEGERIEIAGRVIDGDGAPVIDAVIEIWQADSRGVYRTNAQAGEFTGWGRQPMSEAGWKAFVTAEGVGDWVVLHGGPTATFRTASFREAARLAAAIAEVPGLEAQSVLTVAAERVTSRHAPSSLGSIETSA